MIRLICLMMLALAAAVLAQAQSGPAYSQSGPLPAPGAAVQTAPRPGARIPPIASWGYQLQAPDADEIAGSPFDLVVIDYSSTGDEEGRFTKADLQKMQKKPDGGRRVVLAYMSIGEAENYRHYWNDDWVEPLKIYDEQAAPDPKSRQKLKTLQVPKLSAPLWLGRENEGWSGNFLVRYWEKGWQDIIFGTKDGYLERIIEAGFDGVYLDRVDVYYNADGRPTAKDDMVGFVTAIARRARTLNPAFAVVPQNGEELLEVPEYLAAIDGIAKEDLLYGQIEGRPNAPDYVTQKLAQIAPAKLTGLPVLVVEYVLDRVAVERLRADFQNRGFIPYFAERGLERLIRPEDIAAGKVPGSVVPGARPAVPAKTPAKAARPTAKKSKRGR